MNIILLSGGSGKRLWPLSNDIRSKQFIKIFKDKDGCYSSMLQNVYKNVVGLDAVDHVIIATSESQIPSIANQIGADVKISKEPERRDTFPAMVLAAAYLHDVEGVDAGEPVIICPVDPYVEAEYFDRLIEMGEAAARKDASNLVLMGIEPTYPSEKYGYIIPADTGELSKVKAFKEKPSEEDAKKFIADGALWNSGAFACKVGYLLGKAHEMLDFTDYDDLYNQYASLPKISFDYAVVEKEPNIAVLRFSGEWKDLGTWNTFTEAMDEHAVGRVRMDDTCENTHIINELDIPILGMGLRNMVVVAGPDGILVSDKEQSAKIKPYVENITQQVMYADKSWGTYKVIDIQDGSLTIIVTLAIGHQMSYHSHSHRDEVWNIVAGEGHTYVDGMRQHVKVGDVITIAAGCRHTIMADMGVGLKVIEVQIGSEISDDDKERYELES